MLIKWTTTALGSVDEIAGFVAKDYSTREIVLHKNYIAIYCVRGDDVEILKLHHVARNL